MSRWKLDLRFHEGHRYFIDTVNARGDAQAEPGEPVRVAVADASGATPETTEDGILWLDKARPIVVSLEQSGTIPVVSARSGDKLFTGESAANALLVAARYGLRVHFHDDIRELIEAALPFLKIAEPQLGSVAKARIEVRS